MGSNQPIFTDWWAAADSRCGPQVAPHTGPTTDPIGAVVWPPTVTLIYWKPGGGTSRLRQQRW